MQASTAFKVSSSEDVQEIYKAKRLIVQLAANWLDAIRAQQNDKAAAIRRRSNQIKREIREKYEILL